MKRQTLSFLLFGSIAFLSCGDGAPKSDQVEAVQETNEMQAAVEDKDSKFMVEAASGGMMEVVLGKLAQQKAKSQRVKDFGAMMVRDHSKANDELKALAANKNVSLPLTLGENHQKHVNELQERTGAAFDDDYMSMMIDDHEKDIAKFEEAANNGKDANVKDLASKTLPVLRMHLDSAKAVNESLDKK